MFRPQASITIGMLTVLWQLAVCDHAAADEAPATASEVSSELKDEAADEARLSVSRAERFFSVGNYEAAIEEFLNAYRLLEHHARRYVVLHNLGVCNERLFRYDSALHYYERYLHDGGPTAQDRIEVEAVVRTLRGLLAVLSVESNVGAEVWIDDRKVGHTPGEFLIAPGAHVVELHRHEYETQRRDVHARPQEHLRLRVLLRTLPAKNGISPAHVYAGGGLTVAALATGIVLGARALTVRDRGLEKAALSIDSSSERRSVKHLTLAADIALASAVVLGLGTTLLAVLTDWAGPERERAATQRVALLPSMVLAPSSVHLEWSASW